MNIFVLDEDPVACAQAHCDKHVVKMVLETAQLLSTALHEHGVANVPYKPTHKNHPCAIWARESIENFLWAADLGLQLALEYTYRYNKVHKSEAVIRWCLENCPQLPHVPMTERPSCVVDEAKFSKVEFRSGGVVVTEHDSTVETYRRYYRIKARSMDMAYTNRKKPDWLE